MWYLALILFLRQKAIDRFLVLLSALHYHLLTLYCHFLSCPFFAQQTLPIIIASISCAEAFRLWQNSVLCALYYACREPAFCKLALLPWCNNLNLVALLATTKPCNDACLPKLCIIYLNLAHITHTSTALTRRRHMRTYTRIIVIG